MFKQITLFTFFSLFLFSYTLAQNHIRVVDPNSWEATNTTEPGWHEYMHDAEITDLTIVADPQGIYTAVDIYANLTHGSNAYSWSGEYEIIWQFELPNHAIVHDSWLWIDEETIVQADVVDYWTALTTYEEIVERNQDPSFLYQLPDNRYEIRIYPLFEGDYRRIKMSFLIPAQWSLDGVTTDLLTNLFNDVSRMPDDVYVRMPVSENWEPLSILYNNVNVSYFQTVEVAGQQLHQWTTEGALFQNTFIGLKTNAPLNENNVFASTYTDGDEQFYQLAYLPDWNTLLSEDEGKDILVVIDYDANKTETSASYFINNTIYYLNNHLQSGDHYNIVINTANGIQFLSDTLLAYQADGFEQEIEDFFELQEVADLEGLLSSAFSWAQDQEQLQDVYLIAANDDFVHPTVANQVLSNLSIHMPNHTSFTVIDYQDEQVSSVYVDGLNYQGNIYFYETLTQAFEEGEFYSMLNDNAPSYSSLLFQVFEMASDLTGLLDYSTSLDEGICYQRYNISSANASNNPSGALLQTGRYQGQFPMTVEGIFLSDNGNFYTASQTINESDLWQSDSLMRKIWYGPHLKQREASASAADEILDIVDLSIQERVLTAFTAFLALEPEQGGEECFTCFNNEGEPIVFSTEEQFDPKDVSLSVSPNPASQAALIQLEYKEEWQHHDWTARVVSLTGKTITDLGKAHLNQSFLEWNWLIEGQVQAGLYIVEIESELGRIITKIVVVK